MPGIRARHIMCDTWSTCAEVVEQQAVVEAIEHVAVLAQVLVAGDPRLLEELVRRSATPVFSALVSSGMPCV